MDVLFYHLAESRLDQALPLLVARCRERDWSVFVQTGDAEQIPSIDEALWTYRDDSFLAHGAAGRSDFEAERHPVWIDSGDAATSRDVHFAVNRATPEGPAPLERLLYIFDGHDAVALAQARERWTAEKEAGHKLTYWQQDGGRWVEKATANG
ncbi:DNA polymerase III subunit chi [Rhizobiaceae bacterium]|nr:DNA polymerase III subunit chi [Rhizobiaceae bacterium]